MIRTSKPVLFFLVLVAIHADAQKTQTYPDSLKGIVLKIEPLAFLYDHVSGGIEIPAGKAFLDINAGVSGIGVNDYYEQEGGFLAKVGLKIPFLSQTPFSILYLMPEVAYSRYRKTAYDPVSYGETKDVNATAIMLCLGFRHLGYRNFYYDAGVDLGYGWANHGEATNNYNFMLSGRTDYMRNSISGPAFSCHLAAGLLLRRK